MTLSADAKEGTRIPIVIGVTGHKDIREQDITILEKTAREIFREIDRDYPHSPIMLLSPLAEGADRLVARVALEEKVRLVVPLPFPIDDYLNDFEDQNSRDTFRVMLGKSLHYFVISPNGGKSSRELSYEHLGSYVAHHCHILIALWDGVENNLPGGTASVVRCKLEGIPEPLSEPRETLYHIESGPVYQIVTPRTNTNPSSGTIRIKKSYPAFWGNETKSAEIYRKIFGSIDKYNRDLMEHGTLLGAEAERSKSELFDIPPERPIDRNCEELLSRYSMADVLANKFKLLRMRTIAGLLILIAIAFFFFQIYLEFVRTPFLLFIYPLFLGVGTIWYLYARKKDYEFKHEDYRALAEAMRVQFFWKLVGLEENAAEHYLRKHKGELEWIRYAVRVSSIPLRDFSPNEPPSGKPALYHLALGEKNWIDDQRKWFRKKSDENHLKMKNLERIANSLFVFGMFLALVLLSTHYFTLHNDLFHHALIVSITMSLTVSAIILGFNEKMVFSEQSKQYERMATLYDLAYEKLRKLTPREYDTFGKKIFFELGKEALVENGDWLLLHRSRPLEIPRV